MSHREKLETVGKEAFSILVQFYEYDRNIPLNARVITREEQDAYIREKIAFRGAYDSRVPGYLGIPRLGSAPYPCILIAHGAGGSKETWWGDDLAWDQIPTALLSSGFAVLTLDAPYHGERTSSSDFDTFSSFIQPNRYRELMIQWTVEYRIAMDYLATRSEVDHARIGKFGISLGGLMSFLLTAVDPRIKAAVACIMGPITIDYMNYIGWDGTAVDRLAPVAPQNYAPAIRHAHFLMQNGKNDPYNPVEHVQSLFELINNPSKELALFETGHHFNAEFVPRAVEWFRRYLK